MNLDMLMKEWLPKHLSVCIEHNPHETYYLAANEYLDYIGQEKLRVPGDEMWVVTIYPLTPIGFVVAAAETLEDAILEAKRGLEE